MKENRKYFDDWRIIIEKKPLTLDHYRMSAGEIQMEEYKTKFNIETANLDRDTQCPMLKMG